MEKKRSEAENKLKKTQAKDYYKNYNKEYLQKRKIKRIEKQATVVK